MRKIKRDFEFWNADEECVYYDEYEIKSRACTNEDNKSRRCSEAMCPLEKDDEFED